MIEKQLKRQKNIVVTGGNNGIGYETVLGLYLDGHNIIFGSRNTQRNKEAVQKIQNSSSKGATNGPDANSSQRIQIKQSKGSVVGLDLDLSKKESVEKFAKQVKQKFDVIDILVNNAGLMMGKDQRNSEELGFQMTLVINHFGHFYLTHLLFDRICKAEEGRVINLSSMGHYWAPSNFLQDLECRSKKYDNFDQYYISKLFNVLFTVGLNDFLQKKGIQNVKTASVHPGAVDTGFGNISLQQSGCLKCLKTFLMCCFKNQQQGATTSLFLCRVAFSEIVSGQYYNSDTRLKEMDKRGRNMQNVVNLWKISQKAYGITF